jgi:hypothetical protein
MVQWTKEHPFGTFLLNIFITIFCVFMVLMVLVSKFDKYDSMEPKIDKVYINSEEIKTAVIEIAKKSKGDDKQ